MHGRKILLVGCNGRFGRTLGSVMRGIRCVDLLGVDTQSRAADEVAYGRYLRGSIVTPTSAIIDSIEWADWVVLCIPESVVLSALPILLPRLRSGASAVDIASVKSRIAHLVTQASGSAGYVSLHPLHGPQVELCGGNIAFVPVRESRATRLLERYLRRSNRNVVRLSATEHDRLASLIQTAPHAILLAYGIALATSGFNSDLLKRVETPVQRTLLALLSRVLLNSRDTYRSIQFENPYAGDARKSVLAALEMLDVSAGLRMDSAFDESLEKISEFLAHDLADLFAQSRFATREAKCDSKERLPPLLNAISET